MRLSSSSVTRTLLLLASVSLCASAVAPRPFNNPPRRLARRKRYDELVAGHSATPAASTGDFTVQVDPASFTISQFGVASGTVTLTGENGFADTVSLSCNVAGISGPNQPFCFFTDIFPVDQVLVDSSKSAVVTPLEVDAVTPGCFPPEFCNIWFLNFGGKGGPLAEIAAALFLLALIGASMKLLRTGRSARIILPGTMMLAIGLAMVGCANGPSESVIQGCPPGLAFNPGTPPGTYMLTVIATNGVLTHSVTVPLLMPVIPPVSFPSAQKGR